MMSNTTAVRPWPTCGRVVHRRAAHVHRHLPGLAGGELDGVARERVADADHGGSRVVVSGRANSADSSSATAQHWMPSRRPTAPMPSPRLGVIDTCAPPSASRTASVMASRCGASRGSSAFTTTSTFTTDQPAPATRATTSRSKPIDDASRYASSDAGNSAPRSGRPAGPSSASATAWRPRRRRSARRDPDRRRRRRRARAGGPSSPNGWTS